MGAMALGIDDWDGAGFAGAALQDYTTASFDSCKIYEVDRVNKVTKHFEPENSSSRSSNSHHHSIHQNNALFRNEMLDHTIEEDSNDEDSMDNLLFVVNEFRR